MNRRQRPETPDAYDQRLALQLAGGDKERAMLLMKTPLFQLAVSNAKGKSDDDKLARRDTV